MKALFWLLLGITIASTWFEAPAKDTVWSGLFTILVWSGRIAVLLAKIDSMVNSDLPKLEKVRIWAEYRARRWWRVAHHLDHQGKSYSCLTCLPASPSSYTETSPV